MVEGNAYVFCNRQLVLPFCEIKYMEQSLSDSATIYLEGGSSVTVDKLTAKQIARGLCQYHKYIATMGVEEDEE